MRSLINKKDNSRQNQLILGVGLIILMVFSTLGYALTGRNDEEINKKIEYQGIEFVQDNSGYWLFEVQGDIFITKYNPEEVEDISFSGNLRLANYQDKPLYFIGDANEPVIEIARNIERFVLRIQNACINKEDCEEDLPVKNCFEDNVIIIAEPKSGETEDLYQEGNCIFITANFANQTRYADKFIYNLLGI